MHSGANMATKRASGMAPTDQNPIDLDSKSMNPANVVEFDKYAVSKDVDVEISGRLRLVKEVGQLLAESGYTEEFDVAAWVDRWLHRPNHALGGDIPERYLHSHDGVETLSCLIGAMASGSYL
jgi:hypothetical protein